MPADEKTREHTEGAAKAVQAMRGDSFSAKRIQDGSKSSNTFGVKAEPPALSCRDDVLVENCAAVPKSCLSPLEMRTPKATGENLYSNENHLRPANSLVLPDRRDITEDFNSIRLALQQFLPACSPSCRRVTETKLGQNLVFDPGGFTGRLRAYPFLGTWRALLSEEVMH